MVGRITGSEPIVHSRASEPLMVSTAVGLFSVCHRKTPFLGLILLRDLPGHSAGNPSPRALDFPLTQSLDKFAWRGDVPGGEHGEELHHQLATQAQGHEPHRGRHLRHQAQDSGLGASRSALLRTGVSSSTPRRASSSSRRSRSILGWTKFSRATSTPCCAARQIEGAIVGPDRANRRGSRARSRPGLRPRDLSPRRPRHPRGWWRTCSPLQCVLRPSAPTREDVPFSVPWRFMRRDLGTCRLVTAGSQPCCS